MGLNFGGGSGGLFPTSQAADVGFRTKTDIDGIRREEQDPLPDVAPGEIVLFERGEGKGEFNNDPTAPGTSRPIRTTFWAGQQFTLGTTSPDGDFTIVSVGLRSLWRQGAPGGTVTMILTELDGSGKPTGSALATATNITENSLPTSNTSTEVVFTFGTPYTLKASTMYAFYIKGTGGGIGDQVLMDTITAGAGATYSGGNVINTVDGGTNWTVDGGVPSGAQDVWFNTLGGGKFLLVQTSDNQLYQSVLQEVV